MKIDNIEFNAELMDILQRVQEETKYFSTIRDTGQDIMVTCPYHKDGQERRPSAGIRKSDGLFHCFTCGLTRSLPQVLTHCFGQDENTSNVGWVWLLKNYAAVEKKDRKEIVLDYNRASIKNHPKYVPDEELESYRYIHPYMYKRKLTDEIIELFDIGYDKDSNCITFPVRDIKGNCLFIARRNVDYKYFNYPQGVEKPLYGIYELKMAFPDPNKQYPDIIVCESMLDALTCWVYGKYAVALNGTGSELQYNQLNELGCRKLILATDNDDAGRKARFNIREKVKNKLITEYVLPSNRKDINELSQEEFENLSEVF